jgi:FKBP-type peptidyl-prolyl cis-trans isomerase
LFQALPRRGARYRRLADKTKGIIYMRFAVMALLASAVAAQAAGDPLGAKANGAYLAANAKTHGVVVLPGIQYQVLKKGSGAQSSRHDCVTVNYKGSLIDGKVFDETKPGAPATFPAGMLIPGWIEALQMMHEGDKWRLVVPAGLAYGKSGAGNGVIPPDQTLIFEIELLKVSPMTQEGC